MSWPPARPRHASSGRKKVVGGFLMDPACGQALSSLRPHRIPDHPMPLPDPTPARPAPVEPPAQGINPASDAFTNSQGCPGDDRFDTPGRGRKADRASVPPALVDHPRYEVL